MSRQRILGNAVASVGQIFAISGILFFLYRYLLKTIGVEQLGIWSLVLATVASSQIAQFGLSGSVVRFVAKHAGRGDPEQVARVIQTSLLSMGSLVGAVLVAGWPAARWLLKLAVPPQALPLALVILPYALTSFWLMSLTSVIHSGLDGHQRIESRSLILVSGAVLHFVLCVALAPRWGLRGVAIARLVENTMTLAVSWLVLRRYCIRLPLLRLRWHRATFREIIGYGLKFQAISATALFFDPMTKLLLSRFGGLSMVGFYEMAVRAVQQVRAIIVSANQVLVPEFARVRETDPRRIPVLYRTSFGVVFFLSLPAYALLIGGAPLISRLWIGRLEPVFIGMVFLLSVGWFFNTLNAPAYFAFLGSGSLRWNIASHVAMAILNVVLGFLAGKIWGGWGVLAGWVLSLALGSSIAGLMFHRLYSIPAKEPGLGRNLGLGAICLSVAAAGILRSRAQADWSWGSDITLLAGIAALLSAAAWKHPVRAQIWMWLRGLTFGEPREAAPITATPGPFMP